MSASTRQKRAEEVELTDVRRISETVWEVDLINDQGQRRENVTIVPSDLYSPTKDMQYRGPRGIVDKYIRALAMENDDARQQLITAIQKRRNEVQEEISHLREKDSNLLQAQADIEQL